MRHRLDMYQHVLHVRGFENVSRVSGNSVFLHYGLLLFDSKADCRPTNALFNFVINRLMGYVNISIIFSLVRTCYLFSSSWKHLSTKVAPDFHLTDSKMGEIWGWYQINKK